MKMGNGGGISFDNQNKNGNNNSVKNYITKLIISHTQTTFDKNRIKDN